MMENFRIDEIARLRYGKLPPKTKLRTSGYPIFTGYRVSGFSDTFLYREPQVVVVARGVGGTGNARLSPPESWITNLCIVLEVDDQLVEKRFLASLLQQHGLKQKLDSGSAQSQITINSLGSYQIYLPPLCIQRRVADILSAYDDLIENNNRRMALLEESIHLLYREWFVYLRFPGHERAEIVDGVPKGWRREPLSSVCDVNSESLSTKRAPARIRYIAINDVSTGRIDSYEDLAFDQSPSRARRVVRDGDIIWAMVRPGNRAYAVIKSPIENTIVSTGFAVLRPRAVGTGFLYGATTNEDFVRHMTAVAQGAAYPAAKAKDFADYDLRLPPSYILRQFEDMCGPTLSLKYELIKQNEKLREARDLLLPRLMDGRIPV